LQVQPCDIDWLKPLQAPVALSLNDQHD
jgi:hypothetical protein